MMHPLYALALSNPCVCMSMYVHMCVHTLMHESSQALPPISATTERKGELLHLFYSVSQNLLFTAEHGKESNTERG